LGKGKRGNRSKEKTKKWSEGGIEKKNLGHEIGGLATMLAVESVGRNPTDDKKGPK